MVHQLFFLSIYSCETGIAAINSRFSEVRVSANDLLLYINYNGLERAY